HDLALRGLDDDPVAPADWTARPDDQNIAVAIERKHRVPLHLEGIGTLVRAVRQFDHLPALPRRKSGVVEETAGPGLGEADQRDGRALPRQRALDLRRPALDQLEELF